jgi:hypothetical protein
MRGYLMWASLIILVVLAGVEVALAVMRDAIVAADVALKQSLGGAEAAAVADAGWVTKIPTFGQMILGFTLPFALAFVAIPLEYLINSGRVVLGALLVQLLRGAAFGTRLLANLVREAGKLAVAFYDILIFVPLAIERWVKRSREQNPGAGKVRAVPAFEKQAAGR